MGPRTAGGQATDAEAIYVDVLVYRRRETRDDGSRRMAGPKRLFVYAAMAYLDADGPTPLLLWADTADDRAAWARFYGQVADLFTTGGAPRWVVSDGEHAAHAAIPQVWPTAKLWRCHWHIQRIACDHLKRLKVPANDPRFVNASKLMGSKDHWEQFAADAPALGDRKLDRWVATNRGLIEQQLLAVAARHGDPIHHPCLAYSAAGPPYGESVMAGGAGHPAPVRLPA